MTNVTIGSGVTSIGKNAFANCTKLTTVKGASKVTELKASAFSGCKALKSITIKTTKLTEKAIGPKAFSGINSSATIKVPSKKLKDYTKWLKKKGISGKNQKIKK